MKNIIEIASSKLGDKIGTIVPFDYQAKNNENVFICYLNGDIPIKIKSKLNYEEFQKIC